MSKNPNQAITTHKGDVVRIEYEGYILPSMELFDTNIKEVAEKHHKKGTEGSFYSPLTIIIGKNMVVKGLDKALVGKEINKRYEITLNPEDAFGKYNPALIKTYPLETFIKQKVTPHPGMIITLENNQQVKILSVTGRRVKVDFNHPLAGKRIYYKFKIIEKVEDIKEKFIGVFRTVTGVNINEKDVKYRQEEKELVLSSKYKGLKEFMENFVKEFFKDDIRSVRIEEISKEGSEK